MQNINHRAISVVSDSNAALSDGGSSHIVEGPRGLRDAWPATVKHASAVQSQAPSVPHRTDDILINAQDLHAHTYTHTLPPHLCVHFASVCVDEKSFCIKC